MQLQAPITTSHAVTPVSENTHDRIGTARYYPEVFGPIDYADLWTVGHALARASGPTGREQALESARMLSLQLQAPVAVSMTFEVGEIGAQYIAYRIARTGKRASGQELPPGPPMHVLTDAIMRSDRFAGWRQDSFGLVGIYSAGALLKPYT